jgi:hypothetical protein
MRIKVGKPSPGLVVACVALIVALAGTALALPGRNTVDSGDIKNGQVKPADLNAKSLSPRAYAHVTGDNTVTAGLRRGIRGSMVNVENDTYCFDDLGFTPRHVQATVDHDNTTNVIIQASLADEDDCPGSEKASVKMQIADTEAEVIAANFFIAFY